MAPGPLRGRSEPMARVLAVLRAARSHGYGGVLVVSGPPGIGKTALLREICRQAGALRMRVAAGKCDPIEQVWPGAPILILLRDGRTPLADADEYADCTGAVSQPLLLAERVASILEPAAAGAPVQRALEDVQWGDRTSRLLVRALMPRLIGLPVVWVLAGRDDLGAELARHDPAALEQLRLAPLSGSDLVELARDRLGHAPDERTLRFLHAAGTRSWPSRSSIALPARNRIRRRQSSLPRSPSGCPTARCGPRSGRARRRRRPPVADERRHALTGATARARGGRRNRSRADPRDGQSLTVRHDLVGEAVPRRPGHRAARRAPSARYGRSGGSSVRASALISATVHAVASPAGPGGHVCAARYCSSVTGSSQVVPSPSAVPSSRT